MARNDYSRRSNKDVFWGDDNNNKNSSKSDELEELFRQSEALEQPNEQAPTPHEPAPEPPQAPVPEPAHPTGDTVPIFDFDSLLANGDEPLQAETPRPTPPPYKPSKKSKKVSVTRDDFNIDKFISDNSDGISEITTSKTISIVIWIGVALLVAWWLRRWVAAIVLCFLGYTITKSTINSKYKKLISVLANKINAVKSFYKSGIPVPLSEMMMVKSNGGKLSINSEDMLTLNIGGNDVSIEEFALIETQGKEQDCLFTGLYAIATLPTNFDGEIILRHGNTPIPTNKYPQKYTIEPLASRYTILAKDNVDFDACDIDSLAALADNVRASNGDKPFVMLFKQGKAHFITSVKDIYTFDYGFFDNAKDCIRRDIQAIDKRVRLAMALEQ
ncbi:MAG: hypothetical protein II852_03980 [Bacteroidales bacterium]|nr:hypothetical protein [Bacteroidales bacterium]